MVLDRSRRLEVKTKEIKAEELIKRGGGTLYPSRLKFGTINCSLFTVDIFVCMYNRGSNLGVFLE